MSLFDLFKKKAPAPPPARMGEVEGKAVVPPPAPPSRKSVSVRIPDRIGDCIRAYYYPKVKIIPVPGARVLAEKMQESGDWKLEATKEPFGIELAYGGEAFASLAEREDMVSDWLQRGDPMLIFLGNLGDSGNYAAIAFYRDEQKRLAHRESEVVKLTRYANQDAQFALMGLEPGVKLDVEEDYDREGSVLVMCGDAIGALPKKSAERFLDEGCAGVFLDHIDYDDEKDKDIPYVKIYW